MSRFVAPIPLILLLFVGLPCLAAQHEAQEPDRDSSPRRTYLVLDSRSSHPDQTAHYISLARRDHPNRFSLIYRYPRLADLYFSPDE